MIIVLASNIAIYCYQILCTVRLMNDHCLVHKWHLFRVSHGGRGQSGPVGPFLYGHSITH